MGRTVHDSCLSIDISNTPNSLKMCYNVHTHLNICSPGPAVGDIPEMSSPEFLPLLKPLDCNREGKFYVVVKSPPEKVTAYFIVLCNIAVLMPL